MYRSLRLFTIIGLMVLAIAAEAQPYQTIGSETSTVGEGFQKTVITVQAGDNPIDRFRISRVAKRIPAKSIRGTILLLPPIGSGFENYEVGEQGDYVRSFVAFFARRNFEVWGYSQRTGGLTAGSCESGTVDCSAMESWGLQTVVDDIDFVRRQIENLHPGTKVFVGGVSLGSMLAVATINAHPDDYAGAFLIEGSLYSEDPAIRGSTANFCAAGEQLLANGVYYDNQGLPTFKLISQLAANVPGGLSPLPGSPPGFTNHEAFVAFLSNPPIGPITPWPGYYFLAGSVEEDRFFFANESLIQANIATFIDYMAIRTIRDVDCALAGERTFTDKLQAFRGPVILFGGGHGFGPVMNDTARLMTSARITHHFDEAFGHVDHVLAVDHRHRLEHPLLAWLLHSL